LLSRHVVPGILEAVEKTRSNELFTLCVLALCAGIAWLGSVFGLSLALGAFVAGLIVSETVYSHKILADILPFKHLYLALFFIGIGIQIEPGYLVANALPLLGMLVVVLAVKILAGTAGGLVAGFPARPSIAAGLGLSSVGEFSLVLFMTSRDLGLLPEGLSQAFLACATLSMGATPVLMKLATPLARLVEARLPVKPRVAPHGPARRRLADLQDHAVICGYGAIGASLNGALRKIGLDTVIVELNAETVKRLVAAKQPCVFADITHEETMRLVGVERAKMLVITVPLLEAARAAIRSARAGNPRIHIICRARYPRHVQPLLDLGVDTVVNEEAETLLEFTRCAMRYFDQSPEEIDEQLRQSRSAMGAGGDRETGIRRSE
jgi:CPA2 family monovalent cation:H+ antiporter-2